jgi:hypothetical protein
MLSDKLKRWLITSRAWEIYGFMQNLPTWEIDLVSEIYEQIDLAIISDALRLHVLWPSLNKKRSVRERYNFSKNQLHVKSYSYALIETGNRVILRADSSPHHERDYRRKLLTNFPHHLHDENGRICSCSGNLDDFIKLTKPFFQ